MKKKFLSTILALATAVTAATVPAVTRAEEYDATEIVYFNGHSYRVFFEKSAPDEAEAYCESIGGYLTAITSEEEQEFISELCQAAYELNPDYYDFYIGATDYGTEGEWRWMNGEEWDYTSWSTSSEPNNGLGRGEDYAIAGQGRGWDWLDVYGGYDNYSTYNGFICEWDDIIGDEVTATPEPEAVAYNTAGIAYFNGHSYKVFDEYMTWTDAKGYCESLGGHLATVTSQDEQDFIELLLIDGERYDYFLGATDDEEEGTWKWITGETWDYNNWNSSSPDNWSGIEDYLVVYNIDSGDEDHGNHWNDASDQGYISSDASGYWKYDYQFGFICEWDGIITSYGSAVSEWSSPEMEEAYTSGLIPENLVGEDLQERVTRSEFAAIALKLYEALSDEEVPSVTTPFKDVSGDKNADEIAKAYGLNIVVGTSDTEFEPNTEINREQLATMLCRTIKKYKFDDWTYATDANYYLDSEGVQKFADDSEISDYAKQSVYYMAKMGIINGIDDTHFAPQNTTDEQEAAGYATATREQAIALSLRIYKLSDMWL